MTTETWIIITNGGVAFSTIVLTLVTLMDVHKEDQRTIRELMLGPLVKPLNRRPGRHECGKNCGKHE